MSRQKDLFGSLLGSNGTTGSTGTPNAGLAANTIDNTITAQAIQEANAQMAQMEHQRLSAQLQDVHHRHREEVFRHIETKRQLDDLWRVVRVHMHATEELGETCGGEGCEACEEAITALSLVVNPPPKKDAAEQAYSSDPNVAFAVQQLKQSIDDDVYRALVEVTY